jgi:hypothetical protein
MQRREALQLVTVLLGGSIIGAEAFLSGCKTPPRKEGLFADEDIALLDEVGETILPATASSPGAKDAKIGEFMKVIVTDCYTPADQDKFVKGVADLKAKGFMDMSPAQRHDLLSQMDKDARGKDPQPYFTMIKGLTVWGFFSSEPGATKALRFLETPGRYDGNFPYKKGDKAWAT